MSKEKQAPYPHYGYVYITLNHANGRAYIGQRKGGFKPSYLGGGWALRNAIKFHGRPSFTVEVVEWADSPSDLDQAERDYIAISRSVGADLYNISPGGKRCYGNPVSEETKAKISATLSGRVGVPCSLKNKLMLRISRAGKKTGPMSEERKARLAVSRCGTSPNKGLSFDIYARLNMALSKLKTSEGVRSLSSKVNRFLQNNEAALTPEIEWLVRSRFEEKYQHVA